MSAPVILWIVLAAALAILMAYRKVIEGSSDELVHMSDMSGAAIAKQQTTAAKLEQLDRVVKILAIAVFSSASHLPAGMCTRLSSAAAKPHNRAEAGFSILSGRA